MRLGLSGMPYSVDAVEQFQVVTSGGQAELGRALGGYVNVVTKSGTNALRGDPLRLFPRRALNAANALSGTTLPMHRSSTAPASAVRSRAIARSISPMSSSGSSISGPDDDRAANVDSINARLAAVGYPGAPVATGIYPIRCDTTNLLGKIDHQFSGGDSSAFATACTT